VCLLLVWRVCDQAFGRRRYRPLKGAEKWSRDHHENWTFAHRHTWKNSLIPKMLFFFDSRTKNNEVIAENPFQNSGVTRRLAVLNWRSSSIHPSSYYYFRHRCYPCRILCEQLGPYASFLVSDGTVFVNITVRGWEKVITCITLILFVKA